MQPSSDKSVGKEGVPPVLTQPTSSAISVRNIVAEDADFAGKMTVDAFESKFKWAVGKNNMEGIKRALADVVRNGSQDYHRSFVAHYEGQRAGLVVLKFPGDVDADGINNITDYISCCGACGLLCMSRIIGNESVPPGHCYIDHICVDASFRGKGIGKALMEVADSYARKRGCHTMYLYVACDNRAKNLYERQGFKVLEDEDGCCLSWCAVGVRHFYRMGKPL